MSLMCHVTAMCFYRMVVSAVMRSVHFQLLLLDVNNENQTLNRSELVMELVKEKL